MLQSGKRRFLQKCIFPASSCKNVFAPKMSFLQSQHKYKCGFEEIFACSQFFPQKCFFIDYQASRSPLTCKQVRGGTSLGLVGLLDMMLEQVSLAAARMLENLTEKLELRSRARKTYRAMLDMAQRVGSSHRKLWPSYPGQAAGGQGQPGRPLEGGARRQDQVTEPGQRTLGKM